MFLHSSFLRGLCTKTPPHVPSDVISWQTEQRCRDALSRTALPEKAAAGVLVTLCTFQGAPSFLYTLRSSKLKGRHKGDISFPGGKCDASDKDVIDTALREAQEELGVPMSRSMVWGPMKPIRDWTGMVIVPVLANIGCLEDLNANPNPEECHAQKIYAASQNYWFLAVLDRGTGLAATVESLLTLPIAKACTSSSQGYTCFRQRGRYAYTLPVFRLPGQKVWGLTAIMTDSTLSLLFPGTYRSVLSGSRSS